MAVILMAEALALELRPFDVSVTTVIPGWVKSDIIANAAPSYDRCLINPLAIAIVWYNAHSRTALHWVFIQKDCRYSRWSACSRWSAEMWATRLSSK